MKAETTQEFGERLIAEATEVVVRQRQFAARLNCEGYTTNEASSLLDSFEIALKNFRRTLALLQSTQVQ